MKNHKKSGLKNQPTPTFDKEPKFRKVLGKYGDFLGVFVY